ncbi:glycosyl transferase [Microbacterium sp. 4R-513]|uniref:glycosyl transferase n=1 Tax=Microbacterium sp. 4R-513 TaxID=2567934 RepID=UPI0013E18C76|nr:glycosyl transferase [Microbacterium sp. 4R-513]QIG40498.1 glycosyl transferase [Microbacterium sp. 4R-513]
MRFVWAVAAFVLAAVMIGAGIAQRTVFQGPKTQTTAISVEEDAPYTLIDGSVLNAMPGAQTLRATGDGTIFAAYGRTADMKAWLSDTTYNVVTLDGDGVPEAELVEPAVADDTATEGTDAASPDATAPADPAAGDAAATGEAAAADDAAGDATAGEGSGRSPIGSDLWLDEFQQDDLLVAPLQLPDTMSVLIATDGTQPAPSALSISWPIENSTPWAGPLIVGGGILMALGIFLYILGIRHVRRSRGPRRKGLPLPVTEPIDLAVAGADKGVISSGKPTRRALAGGGKRAFILIPAVAVSALLFTGCSSDAWPDLAGTPTPSPTESVIVPEGQQAPAVTESQAERILSRIAATVADADANLDATLAATRLDGAMLAERSTNYKLRSAIADFKSPPAIPTKPVFPLLPQAKDEWPRTVMAVVADKDNKTANIMMMTQQDAWSDYKLSYMSSLEAETTLPDLAPPYIGATGVAPDSPFLVMQPDQVAAAYADILNKGEDSEFYGMFDEAGDQFRAGVLADRQKRLDEFNATGAQTGSLTFESAAGTDAPLALATLESGAIVAVSLTETDTVKPTNADAVIKVGDNPTVKTLAGVDQSATGFTTTWSDQLFFYVPSQGSTEKIQLLGYASDILDAKVIK